MSFYCAICQTNGDVAEAVSCSRRHLLHLSCYLKMLPYSTTCPLCRGNFLCLQCGDGGDFAVCAKCVQPAAVWKRGIVLLHCLRCLFTACVLQYIFMEVLPAEYLKWGVAMYLVNICFTSECIVACWES